MFHCFLDLCPPTGNELGLLCGSFQFYHELAPAKKSQDDDNKTFNSYDFHLYGLCCADEQDVEKAHHMKLAFEGSLHAALFHSIFYIVPSDFTDEDSVEIPGTVKTTKLQFRKIDNPNWAVFQRKLHQHTLGFVIDVIVSFYQLTFSMECLFCLVYLRVLRIE